MKKQTSLLVIALLMNTASAVQQPKVGKLSQIKTKSNIRVHVRDDDCVNDDSIADSFGDTCTDYYDAAPEECGNYDTDEFVAADLCCACTGAAQTSEPAEEAVEEAPAEEAPAEEVPAEEAPADDATGCVNDDSVADSFGDTCTDYYDAAPEECGNYDTEDFIAADLCCACQGAAQTSEPAEEEVVEDAPVEEAPAEEAPVEEAPADEGCVNDDSIADSFGDTCTDYYDAAPEECGNYDTEDFVAADLCCAC